MARKPFYDYAGILDRYLKEGKPLIDYSRERTGDSQAPPYDQLKNYAHRHHWRNQREAIKSQPVPSALDPAPLGKIIGLPAYKTKELDRVSEIEDILDRHLKLGRVMHSIAIKKLKSVLDDPAKIERLSIKDVVLLVQAAANLERLALGLATDRSVLQLKINSINWENLSNEDLEKLARGEDFSEVIRFTPNEFN